MVRFKNRWLLVEFIPCGPSQTSQRTTTSKQIWSAVRDIVVHNFGEVGWGAVGAGLNVKYYSPVTNLCIMRVARDHYRMAWAALTLLTSLNGELCIPRVVHCSGTIKQVQIAAIKYDRELIARMKEKGSAQIPPEFSDEKLDALLETTVDDIEAIQD
ncbi:hypothetical protein DACRYDRAFT_93646 [Dacryopinax primogenitus]|uniref:Uncharacterized protein n=1 Tax=Dacryopinax primogenitus (strain DJM 731) TaxID=1858805 RepID=M5G264_DACPD|nr:uncharacterized protein DACRYDRAFT_93646 [Dacryopinax primogenitus]EJU04286.1 hypothetical protein DACRYDRAFT_93646 [Dacryopinax primogenitus]